MDEDRIEFRKLRIPEMQDVLVGKLAERGDWIVASLSTDGAWPVNAQEVIFRERTIWLVPLTRKHFPAVAVKLLTGEALEDCERLLMNFLSVLSWIVEHGIMVEGFIRNSSPTPISRPEQTGYQIREEFDLSYFPKIAEKRASLALALMREGRGLNHPAYAFLSFFRVVELCFPEAGSRKRWMVDTIPVNKDRHAASVISNLQANGIADIGAHLYASGRCAIAHAKEGPIVDPDDPSDYRRLQAELPLIRALATRAIEETFGIETSYTTYRKHLYELAGFKEIIGNEIIERVKNEQAVDDSVLIDIPNITVQIRKRQPYQPLTNLEATEVSHGDKEIFMRFKSYDHKIYFQFSLNLPAERLKFDFEKDVGIIDDGSPEAIDALVEIRRFQNEYFLNGQLQILNAETGALISRKDAYIPVNMIFDDKAAAAGIVSLKQFAQERRDRNDRYYAELNRFTVAYTINVQRIETSGEF